MKTLKNETIYNLASLTNALHSSMTTFLFRIVIICHNFVNWRHLPLTLFGPRVHGEPSSAAIAPLQWCCTFFPVMSSNILFIAVWRQNLKIVFDRNISSLWCACFFLVFHFFCYFELFLNAFLLTQFEARRYFFSLYNTLIAELNSNRWGCYKDGGGG